VYTRLFALVSLCTSGWEGATLLYCTCPLPLSHTSTDPDWEKGTHFAVCVRTFGHEKGHREQSDRHKKAATHPSVARRLRSARGNLGTGMVVRFLQETAPDVLGNGLKIAGEEPPATLENE